MTSSSMKQGMDLDKRSERHHESAGSESFPKELTETLKAACLSRGLSADQAAEEIGISVNIFLQVEKGETPKGSRKVRSKIKAWLEKAG